MTQIEKYNKAFVDTFDVEEKDLTSLVYQTIAAWDSVGHMSLMTAVEEVFDIMLEMDDILDFSSYEKGKKILEKYNIIL